MFSTGVGAAPHVEPVSVYFRSPMAASATYSVLMVPTPAGRSKPAIAYGFVPELATPVMGFADWAAAVGGPKPILNTNGSAFCVPYSWLPNIATQRTDVGSSTVCTPPVMAPVAL